MKLLGSAEKDVDKDKNGENVPKLQSVEVSKALGIEDNVNLTPIIGQTL